MSQRKVSMKSFVIGTIVGGLLFSGVGYASTVLQTVEVAVNPVKFFYNGEEVETEKENQIYNGKEYVPSSLTYKGTVYVPARFMSETAGLNVSWEHETKSVLITGETNAEEADRGEDTDSVALEQNEDFYVKSVEDESLPHEIKEWIEENKSKEFHGTLEVKGSTYALIARGQSPSSGYGIELKEVLQTDDGLTIKAQYTDPKPDEAYLTVITYPTLLLELGTDKKVKFEMEGEASASSSSSTLK